MPVDAKKTSSSWLLGIPYVKTTPTTWQQPLRVFSKTGVSTWTEVWPRLPGQASALASVQPYRNDRIEMDFSWTAANGSGTTTTPVAPASYNVNVFINGALYNSYNIAGTAMTLTGGFQGNAGQPMFFTVTAVSAAGVVGSTVTSVTYTIPQLPAPPAVTSLIPVLIFGDLSYRFNHVSGNRLTGFDVRVNGAQYFYGKSTSVNGSSHPWVGAAINGGAFSIDVYAYGPGGYSPAVHFDGAVPSDVVFTNTRMYTNNPGATVSSLIGHGTLGANSTGYQLYWNQEGGVNNLYGTIGSGDLSLPASTIGGALARFRWVGIPENAIGTGRICYSPFVRRVANPIYIVADDADTYGSTSGWLGSGPFGVNVAEQGYDASVGFLIGYVFYGNKFRDTLSDNVMGFHLGFTQAVIYVMRANVGSGSIQPILKVHKAGNRAEADNVFDGAYAQVALSPSGGGAAYPEPVPLDWVRYLIDQTNGWKGFGFHNPDTSGANNSVYFGPAVYDSVNNLSCMTVRLLHDG